MRLETERLVLREITMDDAQEMFDHWASDPEVTKYLTWPTHESVVTTKTIIDMWLHEENAKRFGIVIKDTNELIGAIDVVNETNGIPEIGYCSGKKWWNHGYMSEACKAFTDYLFSLGYKELFIRAETRNIGSNRVIQKCGFEFIETKQQKIEKCDQLLELNCYKLIK